MELTGEQLQKIVDAVAERLGVVRTADPATLEGAVAPEGAAPPESGVPGWQSPPMVQLPPEFYRSQREIAERVARHDERLDQIDKRFATMQWTIGFGFTVVTVLMTVYNFVG